MAHQGGGHRAAQLFRQLQQQLRAVGGDDAAAGVDHRPLRFPDQAAGFLQLVRSEATDLRLRALDHRRNPRWHMVAVRVAGVVLLDVLGNVDQHRPGTVPPRQGEGLAHHFGNVGHLLYQGAALGNRPGDADDIHFLKGILAQQVRRHIAGDGNDGSGVTVGIGDTGDQVGGTRPGGCKAHAYPAAGAGIALGSVHRALLVFGANAADTVVPQHIKDFQVGTAGVAEQHLHPLRLQRLRQQLGAAQGTLALLRPDLGQGAAGNRGGVGVGDVV